MNNKFRYLVMAALASLFASACKEEVVGLYADDGDGVYFSYDTKEELNATVNFADSILTAPKEIGVALKLQLMGRASSQPRRVILKSQAVPGVAQAVVVCPEVIFNPGEYVKSVTVMAQRPALVDSTFQAQIYIDASDPNAQIGAGIKDFQTFTLHVKEAYTKPSQWEGMASSYFGAWSAAKQKLLVKVTKINNFYTTPDYSKFVQWNLAAVDSLRRQQQATQTPPEEDIPFVGDNTYDKPWYWSALQDKYLGQYESGSFVGLCNSIDVTTANEQAQLGGNEAAMKALNLRAVHLMMQRYNTFYQDGWRQGDSYKGSFYIPMFANANYELVKPQPWADEQGGKAMVEKYYGPYSADKYRFMIQVWLAHKGTDFVLNQMFPIMNAWGDVHWDESLGGEAAIKACNKLFREKAAQGSHNFTFPVVP